MKTAATVPAFASTTATSPIEMEGAARALGEPRKKVPATSPDCAAQTVWPKGAKRREEIENPAAGGLTRAQSRRVRPTGEGARVAALVPLPWGIGHTDSTTCTGGGSDQGATPASSAFTTRVNEALASSATLGLLQLTVPVPPTDGVEQVQPAEAVK